MRKELFDTLGKLLGDLNKVNLLLTVQTRDQERCAGGDSGECESLCNANCFQQSLAKAELRLQQLLPFHLQGRLEDCSLGKSSHQQTRKHNESVFMACHACSPSSSSKEGRRN
eukprot:2435566-Amphidinium_carterae.1